MKRTKIDKHKSMDELELAIETLVRSTVGILETQPIPKGHDFPPGLKDWTAKAKQHIKKTRDDIDGV